MRFTGPAHALRWAFETSNKPIVTVSTSADSRELSRSGETASNGSFNQHERHAQAEAESDVEHLRHLARDAVRRARARLGLPELK